MAAIGAASVSDRVTERRPANRTRTVTVRPARCLARSRPATRSARWPSTSRTSSRVGRCRPSADCAPTDPARPDGRDPPRVVVDGERAELRARPRDRAATPARRGRRPASSPMVRMPRSARRRCRATGPTPHIEADGQRIEERALGGRARRRPARRAWRPARRPWPGAWSAPHRPRSAARPRRAPGGGSAAAIVAGGPNRCVEPVTSRNASSIEMRSHQRREVAEDVHHLVGQPLVLARSARATKADRGQSCRARHPGIPPLHAERLRLVRRGQHHATLRCRRRRSAGRAARDRAAARPTRRTRRGRRAGSSAPRPSRPLYSNICSNNQESGSQVS